MVQKMGGPKPSQEDKIDPQMIPIEGGTNGLSKILPSEEILLEDLSFELAKKASELASQLPLAVQRGLRSIVREMNCYFSFLVDGINISPRDIKNTRTMNLFGYSQNRQKLAMQRLANAYLEIEQRIYSDQDTTNDITNERYIAWIHNQFCNHFPTGIPSLQNHNVLGSTTTTEGQWRPGYLSCNWPNYQDIFTHVYGHGLSSKVHKIATTGAIYHRMIWSKPFDIHNTQVALLLSYASLQRSGVKTDLWSLAKGLIRNKPDVDLLLYNASIHGYRPNLSLEGLIKLCNSFLCICINEIDYMIKLFEPKILLHRMGKHIEEEISVGNLREGSFEILREALLVGEVPSRCAGKITGKGERTARKITSILVQQGYLQSENKHSPLVLAFPLKVVEQWFPEMYSYIPV